MTQSEAEIRQRYKQSGQEHVFDNVDGLAESDRAQLLQQLGRIQVEDLGSIYDAAKTETLSSSSNIEPFSGPIGSSTDKLVTQKARMIGMEAIRNRKVAALVLAGGQGTRLGFDGPKGMYNIQLPSGRTLFQLIAERIIKLASLAGAESLPFYIMTSPINHYDTVHYFEQNRYFGLGKENVFMFQQGMLPCLTVDGKIIMESASRVSMAPDGNGGIYPSLHASGALAHMRDHSIEYLHVFSIDNALVKPADPEFIGFCIDQGADCGNKVVWKADAHEKVGVVACQNGKPCIVEYSELTPEMATLTDASSGALVFGAGNICNHFYTLDFIENVILPNMGSLYHLAHKKIPYWDGTATVTPTENNGIKLESFIFDVFPLSKKMTVWQVEREEEFAPVKNAPGAATDSPDTAREMISNLAKTWLKRAGGVLVGDESAVSEIAPSTSYAGEGLERFQGETIQCPFTL